jgi:hypothetical protein
MSGGMSFGSRKAIRWAALGGYSAHVKAIATDATDEILGAAAGLPCELVAV